MGTGIACRMIDYREGSVGVKQLAWLLHCATVGAVIAPMVLLGGSMVLRACVYTAGVVGGKLQAIFLWKNSREENKTFFLGLSAIAVTAPSEKFLNWAGPLSMGLGVVFISCLGSFFLPPNSALGAGLFSPLFLSAASFDITFGVIGKNKFRSLGGDRLRRFIAILRFSTL